MTRPLHINGKFYGASLNGVHRVADRLIRELDAVRAEQTGLQPPPAVLHAPEGAPVPQLETIDQHQVPKADARWEQLSLPGLARDGILLSLCNLAPVGHRRKVTLIHDVQFLLGDRSYNRRQTLGYGALMPLVARTSRKVLTVSHYSRMMLSLMRLAPLDKTEVLYNGVDHLDDVDSDDAVRRQHNLDHRPYCVLFGSPKPYKNNSVVFEAFRDSQLKDLTLVVVGAERQALAEAGLELPLQAIFVGKINDAALKGLLESACALLFPSRTEGFGLPPAEAMRCGCPVIAAPAGAIPEVCRDAALYADVEDPSSWKAAICQLRDDQELRAKKSASGRARTAAFTWRDAGRNLQRSLEAVAS